ncbi:MAG: insulinase family protein [Nitrospirae bacterium]|nr:insulinase family protein [Nitrospirota bacterium]
MNIVEESLENGLKVLVLEDHKAPVATFQVWYRVGAIDDPSGATGASHLLEHMMFKGTKNFGPKTFSQTINRAGGTDNAFTSHDYTAYHETLSSDRIGIAIKLEADRMRNLLLDPAEVKTELEVVKEERRMRYEDNPQSLVHESTMAAAFMTHPYRNPVIGWMADLNDMTAEKLAAHYRRYYAPNNAVIIVIGDVDAKKIISDIRVSYGHIPKSAGVERMSMNEPPQNGERRVFVKKEAQLPYIASIYKMPSFPDPDSFPLDVLSMILSEGKSSRLYRALVYEKRLALSVDTGYDGVGRGPATFYVGGTVAPSDTPAGNSAETLEAAIREETERIKREHPSEREVQKAKNQVEASFIMEQDSLYSRAMTIGSMEMAGGWRLIDRYLDGIRAVAADDVSRVARKYLIDDHKTTGVLVPVQAANSVADGEKEKK